MVKYAAFVPFAGVRERAKETKKVIFQRVAEFISAARFLGAAQRRHLSYVYCRKAQRSGYFDSLFLSKAAQK
jgi:hypothetical protein